MENFMSNTCLIDPREFGAAADGSTNDTQALQQAIDAAAKTGGTVLLSPGVWRAATLFLKSHITLEIAAGARLEAIPEPALYPFIEPGIRSRMDTIPWRAFLYAFDQENLTIRGDGEIRGRGEHEAFKEGLKGNDPRRPYGLHLVGCRNVRVEGLHLRDSGFWMLRCLQCTGVQLRDLRIWNHADTRNNDGIDIDGCRDVTVSGCHIDSCDDALCLKSEGAGVCENISITNCVLSSFASPLKFGTGSIGGFRNISVNNITIRPSVCGHNHHVLGADGGLAGIDIGNVDGGVFENVTISNVAMRGPETVLFVQLGKRMSFNCHDGEWPDAPEPSPGSMAGVRISNVVAQDVGPYPCCILGYEGNPVRDFSLSNVRIAMKTGSTKPVPWEEVGIDSERYPVVRNIDSVGPAYGLYALHVKNLRLRDVQFIPAEGEARPPVALDHVVGYAIDGLIAEDGATAEVIRRDTPDPVR